METDEVREAFLALSGFDEYLDRFEEFIGLPIRGEAFRKEMALMEADGALAHRDKEWLLRKRKREIANRLHAEIDALCEAVSQDGAYDLANVRKRGTVGIAYLYPDGKRGDVNHALALDAAESIEVYGGSHFAAFPRGAFREIDLMLFAARSMFSGYDFHRANSDAAISYLLGFNRVLQIERLMWKANHLSLQYRSLRSVPDKRLRGILQDHHRFVEAARDSVYEGLIVDGDTHAKWVSEQKAYAIVKARYADAKFQHQPEWLRGQRLDIFIPSRNAAIEYQGKQHSEPVDFFGGEGGLRRNVERDTRKRHLCRANGVKLAYWNYDDPLTDEFFAESIVPHIEGGEEAADASWGRPNKHS